jgi:hypothetical protein
MVPGMDETLPPAPPLLVCPVCAREMRLFGIEPEKPGRDLFTFECTRCGRLEARGISTI